MMPTVGPPEPVPPKPRAEPRTPSHPPTPSGYGEAGFAPGQAFAERYRIIGLLGRGGMGEVYRADDLKLGHPVALKFLSRKLAQDEKLVQRFYSEVRLARQVSHPHVCRVYDVGESEGLLYLSMEYVDGEDLASLLKRIGRLPPDKATDIARELCAGLAAAHDRGVVHRDLKPANVMLDGRGHARITDFGLAIPLEEGAGERGFAGTPAYMAPEQLTHGEVTFKSDLYALGLILYEIFTGKRAFEAKSVAERLRLPSTTRPESVTGIAGTDPAVERAILRCLEAEPAARPASALAVAAALPGGDPLAAALAAGETPSPEMVAAAGGEAAVPLRTAWMLLGGVLLMVTAVAALSPYSTDMGLARAEKGPAVLRERAREIVARFGYDKDPADSAIWAGRDYGPLLYLATHRPAPGWRKMYRPLGPPILFGYRQSPRPLLTQFGNVDESLPPYEVTGMVSVVTDGLGHLRQFRAVPPQLEADKPSAAEFDWSPVFTEARLDPARFQKVEPKWVPPAPFDARGEWSGTIPELPDIPLTVSAAAFRGKLIHFELLGPWSRPARLEEQVTSLGIRIFIGTLAVMIIGVGLAAIFFARRNLHQGRGDRKGAFRISAFMFAVTFLQWAVSAHHAGDLPRWFFENFGPANAFAIFMGAFLWLIYMALEPYLRRRIPELLIGWARLLEGRFRDPRVGRDMLIGALTGTGIALISHVVNGLSTWFPFQTQTTIPPFYLYDTGGTNPLHYLLAVNGESLMRAFTLFAVYFVFRVMLRKGPLAAGGLGVVVLLLGLGGENAALEIPGAVLIAILTTWLVTRIGLLATVTMWYSQNLLVRLAPSFDFSSWYASFSLPGLVLLVVLTLYAFRISLGSQPMFGAAALED